MAKYRTSVAQCGALWERTRRVLRNSLPIRASHKPAGRGRAARRPRIPHDRSFYMGLWHQGQRGQRSRKAGRGFLFIYRGGGGERLQPANHDAVERKLPTANSGCKPRNSQKKHRKQRKTSRQSKTARQTDTHTTEYQKKTCMLRSVLTKTPFACSSTNCEDGRPLRRESPDRDHDDDGGDGGGGGDDHDVGISMATTVSVAICMGWRRPNLRFKTTNSIYHDCDYDDDDDSPAVSFPWELWRWRKRTGLTRRTPTSA